MIKRNQREVKIGHGGNTKMPLLERVANVELFLKEKLLTGELVYPRNVLETAHNILRGLTKYTPPLFAIEEKDE